MSLTSVRYHHSQKQHRNCFLRALHHRHSYYCTLSSLKKLESHHTHTNPRPRFIPLRLGLEPLSAGPDTHCDLQPESVSDILLPPFPLPLAKPCPGLPHSPPPVSPHQKPLINPHLLCPLSPSLLSAHRCRETSPHSCCPPPHSIITDPSSPSSWESEKSGRRSIPLSPSPLQDPYPC
jgi:hypothetical protein